MSKETPNQIPNPEESKEKIKLQPIFFIYRDNDLFQKYISKITSSLEGIGCEVNIQSFPRGTGQVDIEKWREEHQKDLYGKIVVSDRTCSSSFFSKMNDFRGGGYLDEAFDSTVNKILFGGKFDKNPEDAQKNFVFLIQNIFEKEENTPEKVLVITKSITNHSPFNEMEDSLEGCKEAGEIIKKWLIKGGMPDGNIEISDDCDENFVESFKSDLDNEKNWLLIDRHENPNMLREKFKAKVLELPLFNFLEDANQYGLINVKEEVLERELNKAFEELKREEMKK
ncbi:hypothetical protein L6307_06960 [Candidatus Parcubacteria bacterium]|nr:hypothetical protein [Patescibacteria group bacterium]MCG2698791.1 hypothetical protein [Candidatus Parcubacteria bacterium]